jgi:hypothetical protein
MTMKIHHQSDGIHPFRVKLSGSAMALGPDLKANFFKQGQ